MNLSTLKGRSFIKFMLLWIIPEILAHDWKCKGESPLFLEEACNTKGYTARYSQPMKTLNYTLACNKFGRILLFSVGDNHFVAK